MKSTGAILPGLSSKEFRHVLLASGWFQLAPFRADVENLSLAYTFDVPAGIGTLKLTRGAAEIDLAALKADAHTANEVCRCILSLDLDVAGLYKAVRGTEFSWIARDGYGRYLRSATLFEDAFKLLLTTNTNWPRSIAMVGKTVNAYGRQAGTEKAFPTPVAMVGESEAQLTKMTGCGYRAAGLLDLCRHAIQDSAFFTGDAWKQLPAEDFSGRLKAVKGFGPMCISYLCRFYGKAGEPTIDSWVVSRCHDLWKVRPERKAMERFFKKRYAELGEYAATVFWFDITRFWHERDFDANAWWK